MLRTSAEGAPIPAPIYFPIPPLYANLPSMPSVNTPEGIALQELIQGSMRQMRYLVPKREHRAAREALKAQIEDACVAYRTLKMAMGTSLRARIFARDGSRCRYCAKDLTIAQITFDHVVPEAKGGKETFDNLVICCNACNVSKKDQDLAEWLAKRDDLCDLSELLSA